MALKSLLEKCEEKIDKPLFNIDKLVFLWFGVNGDFQYIRNRILGGNNKLTLEDDEIKAFVRICDNRIERLRSFLSEVMGITGFLIVLFVGIATILATANKDFESLFRGWAELCNVLNLESLRLLAIIFFITLLTLSYFLVRYRAQLYAWYAIKEGTLLELQEK